MTSPGFSPINSIANYLPTEFDLPKDNDQFYDFISKRERLTANIVNVKESSQYERRELLTAQQWLSSVNNGAIKTNYGYRLTFDLVSLNGGNIPNGVTTLNLPTNPAVNTPVVITYTNSIIPLHGFGAATIGTTLYFVNDPQIYVRFTNTSPTVQSVVITNTTGLAITQFYWVMEYLKT